MASRSSRSRPARPARSSTTRSPRRSWPVSKRGLPLQAKMRHDAHFVEALAERFGATVGKFLPISEIETNPDQPRRNVGDLSELRASIESKGILEPILVRPTERGRYQIISGERRFRAALEAGL